MAQSLMAGLWTVHGPEGTGDCVCLDDGVVPVAYHLNIAGKSDIGV